MVQESVWQTVFHHGIVAAAVGGGVDRELQRITAVAALGARSRPDQGKGVVGWDDSHLGFAPTKGQVILTQGHRVAEEIHRMQRQIQGDDAVASGGGKAMQAVVGGGQGAVGNQCVAPRQGQSIAADDHRVVQQVGGIDQQGHRHHAVGSRRGREGGGLRAGSGEDDAVPHIRQLVVAQRQAVGHRHVAMHK